MVAIEKKSLKSYDIKIPQRLLTPDKISKEKRIKIQSKT